MRSLRLILGLIGLLSMMVLASANTLSNTVRNASVALGPANKQHVPKPVARIDYPPGPEPNYLDYNFRNPNFCIPLFVLCPRDGNVLQDQAAGWPGGRQNPNFGGHAEEYMFSTQEIWTAFRDGWRHLMNAANAGGYTRDTMPAFRDANQDFVNYAQDHWPMWQPGARFPQQIPPDVWNDNFDPAGWRVEPDWDNIRIFTYPLTFHGRFDGGDSAPQGESMRVVAPGEYRVVFTNTGLYLGVVRLRPGVPNTGQVLDRNTPRAALRSSWMAPVNADQTPDASQGEDGRWNYPGVPIWPSQTPQNFLPPFNVILASVALVQFNRFLGGGSRPPPALQEVADAPLILPPQQLDNGTLCIPSANEASPESAAAHNQGVHCLGWNASSGNVTDPLPGVERDTDNCEAANTRVNRTYQVSCESNWNQGSSFLDYHIAVTGTGQGGYHAKGWCKGIADNMKRYCGGNYNRWGDYNCNVNNASMWTFFTDTSVRGDYLNYVQGIEMSFTLQWPWAESDADHECIAKAIQRGSCVTRGMMPIYPVVCRNKKWFDLTLSEWDWSNLGHA
ncbi:hypothetical protein N8I77_010022 [Diaporthe amygdali]|uniref:Uncharacterized protein n=1 Tax=Phomopsis amygdali TaxID=1214568 RepID=A0AAD9S907_PHOAM|nr:hypothetical protein N8I77_010022 [Diaporthe amygdali]